MILPPPVRWLLLPLSWIYREVVRIRVWAYAKGIRTQQRLNVPVISVGNLTVGGTGKTPMVIWLAQRFLEKGKRVGILTRGYKGSEGTSDEIELMKARLQNRVTFGVGPNRFEQGRRLEKDVDLFLLDDGFQHLQLARDVNILLMDASQPLADEPLLPAGRLREPLSEMGRADLLVFTRADASQSAQSIIAKLSEYPVFSAATRLVGLGRQGSAQLLDPSQLGAGPFFAFCGIGNPKAFFADAQRWGLSIVGTQTFPDHHRYDPSNAQRIEAEARAAGATALLTTEKDLQNLAAVKFGNLPLYVAVIEFQISNQAEFLAAIQNRLDRSAPPA